MSVQTQAALVISPTGGSGTFVVSNSDLVNGVSPTVVGNINAEEGVTSNNIAILSNGSFGAAGVDAGNANEVVSIHNGVVLDYSLDLLASPNGYKITNINTFSGWRDPGRDNQNYTVSVSTALNPNVFSVLGIVNAGGPGTSPASLQVLLSDTTGTLAGNVAKVRFSFPGTENGYVGYREIDIVGTPDPTALPVIAPVTITSQTSAAALTVSATDLLQGRIPTVIGNINAEEGVSTNNPAALTNGTFGLAGVSAGDANNVVSIHNGVTLTYTLDLLASPLGYDVTEIDVFSGWRDPGRDNQNYVVEFATAGNPNTFFPLASVTVAGPGTSPASLETLIKAVGGGTIAGGVAALRFTFPTTENGYVGYREIDVIGTATTVPEPASALLGVMGVALLGLRRRRVA